MRLGQTSVVYFLSKIFGSIIGFFATVYFARALGEVVLGQYALVLAVVAWLGIGVKLGFSGAIKKRISEGEEPRKFIGAGLGIMIAMMSLAVLLVVIFINEINAYIGAPAAEFVLLLLSVVLLKSIINASLQGQHLVHVYSILSSGKQVTRTIAQISLVVLGFGLSGMLWGYAIGYLFTIIIGLWILDLRPAIPEKRHIASLFDYAKFAWLGNVRSQSFSTVDIAVLGFFVTQGLIGIYSVAWSISKILDIFGSAISTTLFPEMSNVSAKNDASAVAGLTEDSLSYAGLILIPGLIGGVVLGDRLMAIYGEAFVAGNGILVILIAALIVYSYNKQFLNTLNAIDRPDLAFRANAVFIIANVTLNVGLIWQFGWIGAATATAISAAIGLVMSFYYTRELIPFSAPFDDIARQWIAALCMGAIVYLARQLGEANLTWVDDFNAVFVVLLVGLGAAVYFVLLLGISSTFRTTVTNNLPFAVPLLDR